MAMLENYTDVSKLPLTGCEAPLDAVTEFAHLKNAKKISELTKLVNNVEEDGDRMYRRILKTIFREDTDLISLMKGKEIFDMMEKVLHDCEDVADLLDSLMIKNT